MPGIASEQLINILIINIIIIRQYQVLFAEAGVSKWHLSN